MTLAGAAFREKRELNTLRWRSIRRLTVLVAAWLSLLMGAVALAGWIWGIETLKSLIPGAVQMKANTAVGLLLVAAALFMRFPRRSLFDRCVQYGLAGLIAAIGMATLSEYLFAWNLHVDE